MESSTQTKIARELFNIIAFTIILVTRPAIDYTSTLTSQSMRSRRRGRAIAFKWALLIPLELVDEISRS
jgi:hypothetical protein